ncbi:MAG: type 4a pilus biogenesis protein PilO [bacterium]|nr:type 4a pilus biogenesis protein PilO [bacterium]
MDKYRRYYGILIFVGIVLISGLIAYNIATPAIQKVTNIKSQLEQKGKEFNTKVEQKVNVEKRLAQMKYSIVNSQKKIYLPVDSDLGNDSLFFTLYNDLIEMVRSNSIKIKSMEYTYNPENDAFVKFGQDVYFVCEINMELVSSYTNLGKLIQDIVQYPYYIKINRIQVQPYEKDKKVLISDVSLRLYAHTAPVEPMQ